VAAGLLTWAVALGAVRAVAHPEFCPTATAHNTRAAATAAVGWFTRNQQPDGSWIYRYDKERDTIEAGYNLVRHAGVIMSLYQAAHAGIPGALAAADAGTEYALRRLVRQEDKTAFGTGRQLSAGASALLTAGLAERREVTGDPRHDDLLASMGRFLHGQLTDEAAILAYWDRETGPIPGYFSPFYTGETLWALARLHSLFPEDGWDVPTRKVAQYISTSRDDAERRFPPISDHWAAYGIAEIAAWPSRTHDKPASAPASPPAPALSHTNTSTKRSDSDLSPLTPANIAYAIRTAGIFGVQTRFESQRSDHGIQRWTRGPYAPGSGLGTIGEGMAALWRAGRADPRLATQVPGGLDRMAERATCAAGMLVTRQITASEAAGLQHAELAQGAWFYRGDTQMDDQQHALSALLAVSQILEETVREKSGSPIFSRRKPALSHPVIAAPTRRGTPE